MAYGKKTGGLKPTPLSIRFWRKVRKTESCWLWTGNLSNKGYGQIGTIKINKRGQLKVEKAHRVVYEMFKGKIPDGLTIDHLCRNRACVNPDHLEAVTNRINILRGIGPTAQAARKTHCKRGHPFNESNTIARSDGGRRCLICHRMQGRIGNARARGKEIAALRET